MDFIKKVEETATSKGKVVADKAKQLAEIASLKSQIGTCEEVIKKNYAEIGKLYYENYANCPEELFEKHSHDIGFFICFFTHATSALPYCNAGYCICPFISHMQVTALDIVSQSANMLQDGYFMSWKFCFLSAMTIRYMPACFLFSQNI